MLLFLFLLFLFLFLLFLFLFLLFLFLSFLLLSGSLGFQGFCSRPSNRRGVTERRHEEPRGSKVPES